MTWQLEGIAKVIYPIWSAAECAGFQVGSHLAKDLRIEYLEDTGGSYRLTAKSPQMELWLQLNVGARDGLEV